MRLPGHRRLVELYPVAINARKQLPKRQRAEQKERKEGRSPCCQASPWWEPRPQKQPALINGYSPWQQGTRHAHVQAVEDQEQEEGEGELGGGVLRKRQKAAAQEQQSDTEAAALQQV